MAGFGIDTSRITPAGAGKTPAGSPLSFPPRDHPRRCGENILCRRVTIGYDGSPPQVRGKPFADAFGEPVHGITPAGAGKTARKAPGKSYKEDHPRRCGENLHSHALRHHRTGSPPQVRGKLNQAVAVLCFAGITPAGAGKTLKRSFRNQSFCS